MQVSTDKIKRKQPFRKQSALACIVCRQRHLKCDGAKPVCGRCQSTGTKCYFVQSRRGYANRAYDPTTQLLSVPVQPLAGVDLISDALATENDIEGQTPNWALDDSAFSSSDINLGELQELVDVLDVDWLNLAQPVQEESITENTLSNGNTTRLANKIAFDPLIQSYYQNFHESHPFLLPRKCLDSPLVEMIPPYLFSAMRLIGAGYHYDQSARELHRKYASFATTEKPPASGFKVQAMLLIAISDHAYGFAERAMQTVKAAIKLSLDLGMHTMAFGTNSCGDSPVLDESWRRTYWELHVVSGMMAVMGNYESLAIHSTKAEIGLPCEDVIYAAAMSIPPSQSLQQFHDSWTRDSSWAFSSFAFRIEAVRLLLHVASLNRSLDTTDDHDVEIIEARIAALTMQLPTAQREIYGRDGRLDEMKVQTQMICSLALIMLHQPRSNANLGGAQNSASCTQLQLLQMSQFPMVFDLPSVKMLRAADTLSHLGTLPSPIRRRSPFMICALAICVLVYSASCRVIQETEKQEAIQVRIQLALGGLNMLGEVWPLARSVKQQLLSIYRQTAMTQADKCGEI